MAQKNQNSVNPNYQLETARLLSFNNFPNFLKHPKELAAAGFFYTGGEDYTQCFSCGITIGKWLSENNPLEEHAKLSPLCKFLETHKQINSPAQTNRTVISKNVPMEDNKQTPSYPNTGVMSTPVPEDTISLLSYDDTRCRFCYDRTIQTLFVPCYHLVSCKLCIPHVNFCPYCGTLIVKKLIINNHIQYPSL